MIGPDALKRRTKVARWTSCGTVRGKELPARPDLPFLSCGAAVSRCRALDSLPCWDRLNFVSFTCGGCIMNLVEQIKDQLANGSLANISSLIGASEGETQSAIGAAVPAVLSALSNMTSSGGAQKVANALGQFETGSLGRVSHMLSAQPGAVLEQGNGILQSLFGGNMVSGIANALSRFAGIGTGSGQKLLGYIMPLVLGAIAGRFAGKAVNPQGVARLLEDQKASISHAMPSGFSLPNIPGLATGRAALRTAEDTARTATSNIWTWLLPLLGVLAVGALLLWYFFGRPSATVETGVAKVTTDLTSSVKTLTESLTSIKDAASAEAALPKLKELEGKLDGMKSMVANLPDADKGKVTELIKASFGKLEDQFAKLLWIPGVGDKIQPTVDGIMNKLAALGGLPDSKVSHVSAEMAGTISSLTASLSNIKDSASAEAALPKLKDINDKLTGAKSVMEGLPEAGRSTILTQLKMALGKLKELVEKVLAVNGVGDKIKPTVEAIMGKLTALTTLTEPRS